MEFNGITIFGGVNITPPPPPAPAPATYGLWAWGLNSAAYGILGLGDSSNRSSPTQIGSLTTWTGVSAGGQSGVNSAAIKTDGTIWTWGRNYQGGLGVGDTVSRSSPTQVGLLTTWSKISASSNWTMAAIKTDGTLWTWGYNNGVNSLGLGNTTYYSSPKQVGALTNWATVSNGFESTAAVKTDGTLWMWGRNYAGCLGLGDTTNRNSPVQVGGLTTWSSVSTGRFNTAAIKTDGTLWTWGYNGNGGLGLGNTTARSSPVQVGSLTNWLSVSAGRYYMAATQTNGTLWAWGSNGGNGPLGLGNTTDYSSPKQVGALTTWSSISTGDNWHTAAIKNDGSLWMWGRNQYGQLGLGNTTYYSSPKQVGSLYTWGGTVACGYGWTLALKS